MSRRLCFTFNSDLLVAERLARKEIGGKGPEAREGTSYPPGTRRRCSEGGQRWIGGVLGHAGGVGQPFPQFSPDEAVSEHWVQSGSSGRAGSARREVLAPRSPGVWPSSPSRLLWRPLSQTCLLLTLSATAPAVRAAAAFSLPVVVCSPRRPLPGAQLPGCRSAAEPPVRAAPRGFPGSFLGRCCSGAGQTNRLSRSFSSTSVAQSQLRDIYETEAFVASVFALSSMALDSLLLVLLYIGIFQTILSVAPKEERSEALALAPPIPVLS